MNDKPINSRRLLTHQLLETADVSDFYGRMIDVFLILLITINVAAVIVETIAEIGEQYATQFFWLEIFSVVVFTIEYSLRVWSCVENPGYANSNSNAGTRFTFMTSPMAIVDLLAILPFYLAVMFSIDLRFLRVLRLLRIFKLTRYSAAMTTLLTVLREEVSNFAAAIFIMVVIMVVAASGIYLVEHDSQPQTFGSIPQSMWWAIVTLTTVGYGDVTPLSAGGKIFASLIMIAGVGLVALPTGILASGFSDKLKRNRDALRKQVHVALEDGVIDEHERRSLRALSRTLGIDDEELAEITQSLIERKSVDSASLDCPYCGKPVNINQKYSE